MRAGEDEISAKTKLARWVLAWVLMGVWALSGALGCGDEDTSSSTQAYVEVAPPEDSEAFFRLPWPNDTRRRPDGTVDLTGFPANTPIVQEYVLTFDGIIQGFATQGAMYFRFSGPLASESLPAGPAESLEGGASVFVVDVTSGSPTYGARVPVQISYEESRQSVGAHTLALLPFPGFALRRETTYAAVVTSAVLGADGKPVRRGRDMGKLLASKAPGGGGELLGRAWEAYEPLRSYLADSNLAPKTVVAASVFTTQDPVSLMGAIREVIYEDLPEPPAPDTFDYMSQGGTYTLFEGTFQVPVFQAGEPPYRREGGEIQTDDQGRPILVRTEPLRFAVSIPETPMPSEGWPVVLYAHGTGGDYLSFHRSGVASNLAYVRDGSQVVGSFAVVGVDQVQHGTRCGELTCNPEMDFFNFNNPLAGRDNVRQGALDNFQLVRFVANMEIASAPETDFPIRFDADNIYFMGHSQGGLTGPPFLAYEPRVKAAVLSGAGGNMILSLLQKTEPVNIPELVTIMLGEDDSVDRFHPGLTLIQTFIEPSDAVNYGPLLIQEPPEGRGPMSVFQSQGLVDHYTPPDLIEALGISLGLTWAEPMEQALLGFTLAGQAEPTARPISGNMGGGEATGVFIQYPQVGDWDGHFVIFDRDDAKEDYGLFFATMVNEGIPTLQ